MNIVNKIINRLLLTCLVLSLFSVYSKSQVLFNNGSNIHAKPGVLVFVDGTVVNQNGEIEVEEAIGISAELIIQQNFVNNAIAGGNGYYRVLGDWENNNTFNSGSGSVFLEGNNQLLTGTMSTYFFNLILDGTGIKSQTIDQFVLESLNLNHLELATENHSMFIENSNVNAVQRTDGFVSSLDNGFLSRTTNTSNMYLFPVGSSIGTDRYRPVEIIPNNTNANTFTVRMANVDATAEGFDRNLVEDDICETNPLFYHRINRTNGTSTIDLSIFFDETQDGNWDGIANWTTLPDEWQIVTGSNSTSDTPLSYASVNNWGTFNETPYILYNVNPDPEITPAGPFCETSLPVNLDVNISGGVWSGTGITDVNAGTFDPTLAGFGTHTIEYQVTIGACTGTTSIIIEVVKDPDATIIDPGDFCNTDAPVNLDAATAGGTWSGNGITDVNAGTFDPATAGEGSHIITYEIIEDGCTGVDQITIQVFGIPNPSINHPGDFCDTDTPINLTAATSGGTWTGTGITDANAGTFDPSIAGLGDHIITYNVGISGCDDSDQITITVNQTPDATITDPGDFCDTDAEITLNSATTGGIWSGTGITNTSTGTFNPANAGEGSHIISYEVTIAGCTGTDQITIDVFSTPDASIEPTEPLCIDDAPVSLSAATDGGLWSGTGITDSSNGVFNPQNAGLGSHTITYNIAIGTCSDSDQIVIEVIETPDVIIQAQSPLCSAENPVILIAEPEGGVWSGPGIVNENTGQFDPSQANFGDNIIIYQAGTGNCIGTGEITITVIENADASIVPNGPFCYEDFSVQLEGVYQQGVWSGQGVSSNGQFSLSNAGVGNHLITHIISGECGDTSSINIEIFPSIIEASYIIENPACMGGDDGYVEFAVIGGTEPYTFEWGGDGYSETEYISGLDEGVYSVTIIDNNGCSLVVENIIITDGSEDCIFIPNAFTPNGDGINDEWIVENIDYFPEHFIQIFNRWGQEVYNGRIGEAPWDGTMNNKPLPTGNYIYVVQLSMTSKDFVGIVTLIR